MISALTGMIRHIDYLDILAAPSGTPVGFIMTIVAP